MSSSLLKSIIRFINRINEVKGGSIKYRYIAYLLKNLKIICSMFVSTTFIVECSNLCFAAFKLVIVSSRYQSRFSMYNRCLIPRIWLRHFRLVKACLMLPLFSLFALIIGTNFESLYNIEIFYDDYKHANTFYLATPIRLTYLISCFGNKAIALTTFLNAETSSQRQSA